MLSFLKNPILFFSILNLSSSFIFQNGRIMYPKKDVINYNSGTYSQEIKSKIINFNNSSDKRTFLGGDTNKFPELTMRTRYRVQPAKPILGKLSQSIVYSYDRYNIPISDLMLPKKNKVNSADSVKTNPNAFARAIVRMYNYGW